MARRIIGEGEDPSRGLFFTDEEDKTREGRLVELLAEVEAARPGLRGAMVRDVAGMMQARQRQFVRLEALKRRGQGPPSIVAGPTGPRRAMDPREVQARMIGAALGMNPRAAAARRAGVRRERRTGSRFL
jgi:hypothetical protein